MLQEFHDIPMINLLNAPTNFKPCQRLGLSALAFKRQDGLLRHKFHKFKKPVYIVPDITGCCSICPASNLTSLNLWHLKSFSPQTPLEHIEIIASIFDNPMISFRAGKLRAPSVALDWQSKRLIEVEARVSYHARQGYVHVASAFPLAHHYRAVPAWGPEAPAQ
ncbi:MAG: hypothetical protein P8168_14725 [Deltaproteobacteria bacterium]